MATMTSCCGVDGGEGGVSSSWWMRRVGEDGAGDDDVGGADDDGMEDGMADGMIILNNLESEDGDGGEDYDSFRSKSRRDSMSNVIKCPSS
jgi:hypothetical protein